MGTRGPYHAAVGATAVGVLALSLLGCGSSSGAPAPSKGAGGSAGSTPGAGGMPSAGAGGGRPSTGGTPGTGGADGTGGAAGAAGHASATAACRAYFTAVCGRIRACNAPSFRPCESPIDLCPDILFDDGSNWSVADVVACTEQWQTADCTALMTDQGPACSQVSGERPSGDPCVFDAQCKSSRCQGGVVPDYHSTCGTCVELAAANGACDEQHVCPSTQSCSQGRCVDDPVPAASSCRTITCPGEQWCDQGKCVPPLAAGEPCTLDARCADGLGCQIEIIPEPDPEPAMGSCEPLPPIGQPCLPTYQHSGLCAEGGTCNSRPTGDCVPLVEIGQMCGYTACVPGAYCQVLGYSTPPPYYCYALGAEGDPCPHEGFDLGNATCMDGLNCLCRTPGCTTGACTKQEGLGNACNDTDQLCAPNLACQNGVCIDPDPSDGTLVAGDPCARSTDYGREPFSCISGLECMCPDVACTAPICATPKDTGENCDAKLELCRQGLACTSGKCAELTDRGIEAQSCKPPPN